MMNFAFNVNEACCPPLESYAFCPVLFSSTNNQFLKSLHVLQVMEVKFKRLWQSGLGRELYPMCSLGENTSVAATVCPFNLSSLLTPTFFANKPHISKITESLTDLFYLYFFLKKKKIIAAVVEKHRGGKLVPLLSDAGALALADK